MNRDVVSILWQTSSLLYNMLFAKTADQPVPEVNN